VSEAAWIERFDLVTRLVHWATAVLVFVLLITGTVLYVPQLSAAIGRRATLNTIHVVAGLLLALPVLVGVAIGRAGGRLRRDLVELGRWDSTDGAWFRRRRQQAGRERAERPVPAGKFNGGQKLVAALFGGALAVQLLTGAIMHWNKPFPDDWRTGATFVHDWAYVVIVVLTIGHVLKAFQEPEPRAAMIHGRVPHAWAQRARPGWLARARSVEPLDGGVDHDVDEDGPVGRQRPAEGVDQLPGRRDA
jgi:cytochrome b subunit of formate dehydrogenase